MHIEDLVTLMKACVQQFYGRPAAEVSNEAGAGAKEKQKGVSAAGLQSLEAVQNIDFFSLVGKKLRKAAKDVNLYELKKAFAGFD